ncbi:unnamed protein product [Allacma fusca]|uniref:Uncharacterized protein n=1 Tax=Allacma fusca TaxID=39272 RepID=A0A8J2PL95_9HEXA|nr:unnamed protein product [Allacma fusca]
MQNISSDFVPLPGSSVLKMPQPQTEKPKSLWREVQEELIQSVCMLICVECCVVDCVAVTIAAQRRLKKKPYIVMYKVLDTMSLRSPFPNT